MRDVRIAIGLAGLSLIATNAARGQAPAKLEFEAASVKPMTSSSRWSPETGGPGTADPGQITWSGATVKQLLVTAYDVKYYQISGPAWLDSVGYAIVVKVPEGTTKEQVNVMWQNLLKERFGMVLHHESRIFRSDEMTLPNGGSKLKKTDLPTRQTTPEKGLETGPDGQPRLTTAGLQILDNPDGSRRILARAQTFEQLASWLAAAAGHPVIDKTGLTGRYDFGVDLDLNQPSVLGDGANQPSPNGNRYVPCLICAMQSALEQELGLKLVKSSVTLDVIVVDNAEKTPTEN
jgi:uncharacterized protein (TIGR03435 family)